MATVKEIADFFLWHAKEAGELISNLKLQKLVYYAQAWHLTILDVELFPDDFQAWIHGPVCPSLYQEYKCYGSHPIDMESVEKPALPEETEELLEEVVEVYLGESAFELTRMTHSEAPWKDARRGLPRDEHSQEIISKESMKAFYGRLNDGQQV